MSTKVPVSPRAGALSSTLKAPLALVLSKCRALGDAGVAASAEQVKQLNVISYRSETPSVPPFDYHSRAKVNKLAQNDRTLAAMPNIEQHEIVSVTGATDPDEDADFIEEVAEHFDMGLPYEHDRDEVISRLERYKQLQPSIFEFLDELDCSVEAIVRLFLDKNVKAGGPRCPYSSKALRARALGEKSRLQQFLDEWPRLENTLSATSLAAERLDAALRASFAFQEEVGMSIWPIAEVWLRRRMGLQATREVRESIAHATSICRICQV